MDIRRPVAALLCLALALALAAGPATAAEPPPPPEPEEGEEAERPPANQQLPSTNEPPPTERMVPLAVPLALSGWFWTDTGFMKRTNAREGQYDQDVTYMQGRFVLAAQHASRFDSFFVKARTELIGFVNEFTKSQFEAHVLDAYVMVGQKAWDIQVGRFLAWELYHRGQGIELYTAEEAGALAAPRLYWLDLARGHENEAGQLAFHLYPWDFLSVEVAGVYGQESNQNNLGVRPALDFHVGGLRVLAGYEYLLQSGQTTADKVEIVSHGVGGSVQYTFPFLRLGVDAAFVDTDYTDIQGLVDGEKTLRKTSVGGFVDINFWPHSIGLGEHFTVEDNEQGERSTHHQAFATYLLHLPLDGLSLKAVYGFALGDIEDVDAGDSWNNDMHSVRLRVGYDFR
ncbi:MAG: hypothetical protein ACQEXJ_08720 [Myxococcota bacterium]